MSPLIIPVALEWVILVTILAPALLIGRFESRPRLGLSIWFAALLSSGLATCLALLVAVSSVFETYLNLQQSPTGSRGWLTAIAIGFAPWILLAVSGIALALIDSRISPVIALAKAVSPSLGLSAKRLPDFEGVRVNQLDLPVFFAAANGGQIYISSAAVAGLTAIELEAVLWHELGHLRARHNGLKALAAFVRVLSPWLSVSKALVFEVERLCELDADRFALRRVDGTVLSETRARFISV